jgi:hypothetical protein
VGRGWGFLRITPPQQLLHLCRNRCHNSLDIPHHFFVAKANDAQSQRLQEFRAQRIVVTLEIVNFTIHFDHQIDRRTIEIDDEVLEDMLSSNANVANPLMA